MPVKNVCELTCAGKRFRDKKNKKNHEEETEARPQTSLK